MSQIATTMNSEAGVVAIGDNVNPIPSVYVAVHKANQPDGNFLNNVEF